MPMGHSFNHPEGVPLRLPDRYVATEYASPPATVRRATHTI